MLSHHHHRVCGPLAVGLGLVVIVFTGADLGCSHSSLVDHAEAGPADTTASAFDENADDAGDQGSDSGPDVWTFTDSLSDTCNIRWGIICDSGTFLDKEYFCINHDDEWKIPYWVGYYLCDSNLQGTTDRTDDYRPDPELPSGLRAELYDYKYSGYDRGHMAPAACFKRNLDAMSTSFLLSNMCPQTDELNREEWKYLEEDVREHVGIMGEAWVFTGPLFLDEFGMNDGVPPDTIGPSGVGVPSHCFKAILSRDPDSIYCAYAFIMENTFDEITGTSYDFMITVDQLEAITHYNFFYLLPDFIEDVIESRTDAAWPDICTWVPW